MLRSKLNVYVMNYSNYHEHDKKVNKHIISLRLSQLHLDELDRISRELADSGKNLNLVKVNFPWRPNKLPSRASVLKYIIENFDSRGEQ